MIQDLENLIKLQDIDLRIREQELAREQYPAALADLVKRIEQAGDARGAAAVRFEKLTGGVKEIDAQTAKLREDITRSRERLNSIQTNREYDAVHAEIEAREGMLGAAESKKKGLEADVERCKAALEEAENGFERMKSELQPRIDDLNAKIGAIDSVIAEISRERDQVEPLISQYTRRTYDSIRKKRKNGKAVSVVGASKTCAVCFMVLRPQLYGDLRRGINFVLCENCGSILVWDDKTE